MDIQEIREITHELELQLGDIISNKITNFQDVTDVGISSVDIYIKPLFETGKRYPISVSTKVRIGITL